MRKRKIQLIDVLTAGTLAILFVTGPAQAVNNDLLNGRAYDLDKIKAADPSCDDFCSAVVDQVTGKSKNIDGGAGWGQSDDQWCANHAVGTNPSVLRDPSIAASDGKT